MLIVKQFFLVFFFFFKFSDENNYHFFLTKSVSMNRWITASVCFTDLGGFTEGHDNIFVTFLSQSFQFY